MFVRWGRAFGVGAVVSFVLGVVVVASAAPHMGRVATIGSPTNPWPAGQLLAFDIGAEGYSSMYIVRPDGSGLKAIGGSDLNSMNPAWSRDGRKLVFADYGPDRHPSLFVARDLSTTPQWIDIRDDDFRSDGNPRWSPDGKRIVYERYHGIAIATIGKAGHQVVPLSVRAEQPDWSPRSDRLAFTRIDSFGSDEPGEIYVANVDGTGLRRITRNGANAFDTDPRWSPDGRTLLFRRTGITTTSKGYRFSSGLYTISSTGKGLKKIVGGDVGSATWSPDGTKIAYIAAPKIHILTLATGTNHAFTPAPCVHVEPDRYESCSTIDWRPVVR